MEITNPMKSERLAKYYLFRIYNKLNPLTTLNKSNLINNVSRTEKFYCEKALHQIPNLFYKDEKGKEIIDTLIFLDYCNQIWFNQPTSKSQRINYFPRAEYLFNVKFKEPGVFLEQVKLLFNEITIPTILQAIFFFSNQPICDKEGRTLTLEELNVLVLSEILNNIMHMPKYFKSKRKNKRIIEEGSKEWKKQQAFFQIILLASHIISQMPLEEQDEAKNKLRAKVPEFLKDENFVKEFSSFL